jgi:hypothetical protein
MQFSDAEEDIFLAYFQGSLGPFNKQSVVHVCIVSKRILDLLAMRTSMCSEHFRPINQFSVFFIKSTGLILPV